MVRYAVKICGQQVAIVEAEDGWSTEVGISSEDQLKRDHVIIERIERDKVIPIIRLFTHKGYPR